MLTEEKQQITKIVTNFFMPLSTNSHKSKKRVNAGISNSLFGELNAKPACSEKTSSHKFF